MKPFRQFVLLLTILTVCLMPSIVDAETQTITFVPISYSPSDVTITLGDSVKWSGNFLFHPLQQAISPSSDTAPAGAFGYSGSNSEYTVTFNTAGTYYYLCMNHGTNGQTMRGSITVLDPNAPISTQTSTPAPCLSKPAAPELTDPPSGTKTTSQKLSLTWSSPACATSYKVELRQDKKTNPVFKKKTTPNATFTTSKLARLHTYFWSVKACNEIGCTSSKFAKFTIQKAAKTS